MNLWLIFDPLTGESFIGMGNGDTKGKIYKQMAGGRFQHMVAVKKAGSDTFELMTRTEAKKCKGAEVKGIAQPKHRFGAYFF